MKNVLKCIIPKPSCMVRDSEGFCKMVSNTEENVCKKVDEKCDGCGRMENSYCKSYISPSIKWRYGDCPMATHIEKKTTSKNIRIGQQKQTIKRKS